MRIRVLKTTIERLQSVSLRYGITQSEVVRRAARWALNGVNRMQKVKVFTQESRKRSNSSVISVEFYDKEQESVVDRPDALINCYLDEKDTNYLPPVLSLEPTHILTTFESME